MAEDTSVIPELDGSHGLEQFLLLAKTATGAAAAQLLQDAMNANGLYVFGELLEMPNIQGLVGTEHEQVVKLLEIFAYGSYGDYKANSNTLPALSQQQLCKLKHLTILSIAAKTKSIPYSVLQTELEVPAVRELEDLIIDAIYHNILVAKLDQENNQLEVECFIGRDIRRESLETMITKLDQWCTNCASVVNLLETQIMRANELKREKTRQKIMIDQEIKSMKQAVSLSKDLSDPVFDLADSSKSNLSKKGIRGSGIRAKS